VLVVLLESFRAKKTDFDAASFALPGNWGAKFFGHLPVLSIAYVVSVPLALGWYLTRREFAPELLVASRYRWGTSGYVQFMEQWTGIAVVLTGGIVALWGRMLSDAPKGSVRVEMFLGGGAVLVTLAIVWRVYGNAGALRSLYQKEVESAPNFKDLQGDPTEGLLGAGWKTPAAWLAAFGIVSKLIDWSGLAAIFGGGS
jgi:hypothetical protein